MISYLMFPHFIGAAHKGTATNEATGYPAERMWYQNPRRLARATGDGADWNTTFNAGTNALFAVDTIVATSNFEHLHVQQHASDSWGSPSVSTEISFLKETIAAAGIALAGCKLTRSAGTWTPHALKAHRLRFATGGTVHPIDDNLTTKLYCQGEDISGGTGDAQILAPKKWVTITQNEYQWIRPLIESQQTAENYYQLGLSVGLRTEFTGLTALKPSTSIVGSDDVTRGGWRYRRVTGPAARSWALSIYRMSAAKYEELRTQLMQQGQAPIVLIPDSTNTFDWAYVLPELDTRWDAKQTVIRLNEVV